MDQVDPSQHPAMTVLTTVRDANGVPVPDLGASAFEIVEDGRTSFPPQTVSHPGQPRRRGVHRPGGGPERQHGRQAAGGGQGRLDQLLDALLDIDADPDRVAFFGINRDVAPDDTAFDAAVEVPFGNDKNTVLNVVNFLAVEGTSRRPSTTPSFA